MFKIVRIVSYIGLVAAMLVYANKNNLFLTYPLLPSIVIMFIVIIALLDALYIQKTEKNTKKENTVYKKAVQITGE